MSTEPNTSENPAPIQVSPETEAIVPTDHFETTSTDSESEKIRQETQALIDAIRERALVDAESAGNFTQETYLNAVRQLRDTVEQNKLFDPDQIEQSFESVQHEAEKNWHAVEKNWNSVVKEVTDFGDRLSEAAKVAWDIMSQSKQEGDSSDSLK